MSIEHDNPIFVADVEVGMQASLNENISKGSNQAILAKIDTEQLPDEKQSDHDAVRFISEEEQGTDGSCKQVMVAYLAKDDDAAVLKIDKYGATPESGDCDLEKPSCKKSKTIKKLNEHQTIKNKILLDSTKSVRRETASSCLARGNETQIESRTRNSLIQMTEVQNDDCEVSEKNKTIETVQVSVKQQTKCRNRRKKIELLKFKNMVYNKSSTKFGNQSLAKPGIDTQFAADVAMGTNVMNKDQISTGKKILMSLKNMKLKSRKRRCVISEPSALLFCPKCESRYKSQGGLNYHMQRCQNMVYNKPSSSEDSKQILLSSDSSEFLAENSCLNDQLSSVQALPAEDNPLKPSDGVEKQPAQDSVTSYSLTVSESCSNVSGVDCPAEKSNVPKSLQATKPCIETKNIKPSSRNITGKFSWSEGCSLNTNAPLREKNTEQRSSIQDKLNKMTKIKAEICLKRMNYSIDVHQRIQPETLPKEKRFKCLKCPYVASRRYDLARHERSHTGEKIYECRQCSYCSTRKDDLARHQTTHGGKRTFKCTHCSYAAVYRRYLVLHIRRKHKIIHEEISSCKETSKCSKSYKCLQCPYAASRRHDLAMHQTKHGGKRTFKFKCTHCFYVAVNRRYLVSHIQRRHKNMQEETSK